MGKRNRRLKKLGATIFSIDTGLSAVLTKDSNKPKTVAQKLSAIKEDTIISNDPIVGNSKTKQLDSIVGKLV